MENNEKKIPVVFGIDEKYILQAFVVMRSILMNSQEHYQFFILSFDNITDDVREFADILKKEYANFEVSVRTVDMSLLNEAKICNQHLSKATYFRLLIPELIKECDKCIYLDCDLIVYGDLQELYAIELEDNYLAGARDCHIIENTPREEEHERILGIPSRDLYVNAGALVMNLKKMREDGLVECFLRQIKKVNWYEDQDVLNVCCYPYVKNISLKYNMFHFYLGKNMKFLQNMPYKKEELEFNYEKPFIVHLGGSDKPWNSYRVKKSKEWWQIAEIFASSNSYQLYNQRCLEEEKFDEIENMIEKSKQYDCVVVWGYSPNGKRLCDILLEYELDNFKAIVDNNSKVWGEKYQGIPVVECDSIIKQYNHILWLISCQVSYKEVILQLRTKGVLEQNILRYINRYEDMLHLLAIDEHAYNNKVEEIAGMEYVKMIQDKNERKIYIKGIIDQSEKNEKEYTYLAKKYNFKYWLETRKEC